MNIALFLDDLAQQGIELWPDGEQLRYRAPESRLTAEIFAQLKQYKADLLAYLKGSETYPLSYGQRGLWFDYQLNRDNTDYNLSTVVRIASVVDLDVLRTAFQHLVNRHPALRTTFEEQQGEPMQRVHHYQAVSFTQVYAAPHLRSSRSSVRRDQWDQETLQAQIMAEHEKLFDIQQGPLFRVVLFTRCPDEHILLLGWHHLIIDGASVGLIITELRTFYLAAQQKTLPRVPLMQTTYAEYVAWQRRMLETEGAAARAFWHEELAGELPLLNLPTDRPHPPVRTEPGARHVIEIPPALAQELRLLARQEGVTLYSLLLAAYQVFLHRYTGQDDLLVHSVTAGRSRLEFARLVGYFASPVAIRAKLRGETAFRDFLQETHQTVLGALTHQDYPFALLVKELQPPRTPGRLPICQSSFVLQNTKNGSNTLGGVSTFEQMPLVQDWHGLRLSKFVTFQDEAQFDLALELSDLPDGLEGLFKYSPELFEPATIQRMAGHFQTLLASLVANPNQHISALPLLTEAERHQLLVEWNDTTTDYPSDACIHDLFAEQAERTPNAVAVVAGSDSLTYRALNSKANQLAHHLQSLGVGPEVLVGICVERSLDMVVGLLGILKAGGAYVPLDPTYPAPRLAFMLQDSAVNILVSNRAGMMQLPDHESRIVFLDSERDVIAQQPRHNPPCAVSPLNLAYVIYTSGSTGKPKGTLVSHRGLSNLAQAQRRAFGVQPESRVLQFFSLNFDASIWEIIMALCAGSTLVLAKRADLLPGASFVHLLREQAISHVTLVPSLLAALPLEPLPDLQTLIVAGEACPTELALRWSVGRRFFNAYGPTETTVCATMMDCYQPWDHQRPAPPIGRPIDNVQLYILDKQLEPVPIGVPGELHIGGISLARGYLNRPKLTEERFIPNPFSPRGGEGARGRGGEGERLYKTGDLARYLPDGNIEFIGRLDHQVKIRGFRIELGEIETTLSQHPTVREAVVIAREALTPSPSPNNGRGEKRLVAYIVPIESASHEELIPALRTHIKQSLPDYMVPAAFVLLDHLPLTPNGKIDRKALPAPQRGADESSYIAPGTPTEEGLAAIWAEVLGIERVGIHDNFFELGGHSLLVTQVTSRVASTFGLDLPVRALFENPTIAQLAERIKNAQLVLDFQGMSRKTKDQSATFSNASLPEMAIEEEEEEEEFVL